MRIPFTRGPILAFAQSVWAFHDDAPTASPLLVSGDAADTPHGISVFRPESGSQMLPRAATRGNPGTIVPTDSPYRTRPNPCRILSTWTPCSCKGKYFIFLQDIITEKWPFLRHFRPFSRAGSPFFAAIYRHHKGPFPGSGSRGGPIGAFSRSRVANPRLLRRKCTTKTAPATSRTAAKGKRLEVFQGPCRSLDRLFSAASYCLSERFASLSDGT